MTLSCVAAIIAALAALLPQDVDEWIRQLAVDDVTLRNRAAESLVGLWESDPVKKRVEEVEKGSTDPELKLRAGSILRRMELRRSLGRPFVEAIVDVDGFLEAGGQKVSAAFLKWFEDPKRNGTDDVERRRMVLETVVSRLTTVEDKDKVLGVVHRRLFDVECGNCTDMAPALWAGGVAPLLKDESAQVRADAASILGRARAKGFDRAITAMLSDPGSCCQPFIANCERVPGCGTCGRPPVGAIAAEALADLGVSGAAKEIAQFLKHSHPQARIIGARALGKLKATEFANDIASLLDDTDVRVQVASTQALTQLGAKAFSKRIGRLLASKESWVRFHALRALADLDAQDQVDGIRAFLKDDKVDFRGEAACALARLGRKECAGEIAALLAEDSPSLKPHDHFWVIKVVQALKTLEAKESARALKRAAVQRSPRLGVFAVDGGPRMVTLAELVDEILRSWGIDPESLKD